jgi:urea transport system substrate-binding protein
MGDADLSGISLGRYFLLRKLGKGGMGVVYEAEDILLNRRVAVKLLPDTIKRSARLQERFFLEAQVAARLNHPNIIAIHDIGEAQETFFIVMELLKEQSLGGYLRQRGPLHWVEATHIAVDCCAALHEAHCSGLVHRDIKPDNILCSPSGTVKVADFGLVKELVSANPGLSATQENTVIGSPQYMSPEQCRSIPVDSRSDIYSLGGTYYSMLTGRAPFGTGALMQLMVDHCTTPTPDPRAIVPDLPAACVDILEMAMKKDPGERFGTAEEMRLALEAILAEAPKVRNAFLVPAVLNKQPARRPPGPLGISGSTTPSLGVPTVTPAAGTASPGQRSGATTPSLGERDESPQQDAWLVGTSDIPQIVPTWWSRRSFMATVGGTLVAAVGGLAIGWRDRQAPLESAPKQSVVKPTLKVGILHSLSGTMAPVTRPLVDATLLAIDELNEHGGLLRHTIEPIVVDGKTEVETYAEAAERLVRRDKVFTLFGGWHPEGRQGIRQVVDRYESLLIFPGDDDGLEDSPYVVYLGGVPAQRILPGLRYCIQNLGLRRFYLLDSNLLYARAFSSILHDEIKELGGKVVGERTVRDELDIASVLRRIAGAEPDLVLSALRGDLNVTLFRAWQKRDKRMQEVATLSVCLDENILTLLQDVDMSGNYLVGSYFQLVKRPQNAQFIDRFRKKYGGHHVVTEAMEAAYSGVYLWAQATKEVGSLDLPKIRQALKTQQFEGPGALYRIDANNHAWKPFHIVRIAAGNKLSLLESSSAPLPPQLFPNSRTRAHWEALRAEPRSKS